jgi:hypothetical protein
MASVSIVRAESFIAKGRSATSHGRPRRSERQRDIRGQPVAEAASLNKSGTERLTVAQTRHFATTGNSANRLVAPCRCQALACLTYIYIIDAKAVLRHLREPSIKPMRS